MIFRRFLVGLVATVTFGTARYTTPTHPIHQERSGRERIQGTLPPGVPATRAGIETQIAGIVEMARTQEIDSILKFAAYLDALRAAAQEAAREAQTIPVPRSSVGECVGFLIPDYIIQRESGGNPNAVNPSSGAIGCSQTLPSHYAPGGACAGLDMYSVDGQRACTAILSDNGTNLQPWAL